MEHEMHHNKHGFTFFRTITLKIPGIAGGNKGTEFSFPDLGDLRYARTVALEVYCAEDSAYAFPEAVPVMPVAQLPLVCLVLNTNDPEKNNQGEDGRYTSTIDSVRYWPLSALHRINSNSSTPYVYEMLRWANTWIVWEKSTVKIAPGGLNNTSDLCIYLGIYYTFFNVDGKPVKRT